MQKCAVYKCRARPLRAIIKDDGCVVAEDRPVMPSPTPLDDVEFLARAPRRVGVLKAQGAYPSMDLHTPGFHWFDLAFMLCL